MTTNIPSVLNTYNKENSSRHSPCSAQAQCINGHYLYIVPLQRIEDSSRTVLFKTNVICGLARFCAC